MHPANRDARAGKNRIARQISRFQNAGDRGDEKEKGMQSSRNAKIFGDKEDPRRRIGETFGESPDPHKAALRRTIETLQEAGIDPLSSEMAAIACLRTSEPKLTLKTASYLVRQLVAREGG